MMTMVHFGYEYMNPVLATTFEDARIIQHIDYRYKYSQRQAMLVGTYFL